MRIEYTVTGAVARITLNRPEKRNALDQEMIAELAISLERAKSARVVLIAAAGPDFCAGMDIAMLAAQSNQGAMQHLAAAEELADLYRAIRNHPRPVVAAVRGRALGGGCGLATACDVVLAAESAQFGYPEVKIGFVPAMVMSLLRRSVGEKRAFDLLAGGEPVSARAALEAGMITSVFSGAEFESAVEAYVAALAKKPAEAVSLIKRLLYSIDGMSFDAAIRAGANVNALARMTGDARQGFETFTSTRRGVGRFLRKRTTKR